MRTTVKLTLAALTAAVLLASMVGSASARNLSVTNRDFRVVWAPLSFSDAFRFFAVRCNVTMEGSFHANTIVKTLHTLIGNITRAIVGRPCTGGEAWAWNGTEGALTGVSSLPWNMSYEGFTGTLPTIAGIRVLLRNTKFSIRSGICLGTYTLTNWNFTFIVAADRTVTITPGTESFEPSEGECPSLIYSGTSSRITLLGTATSITVTLI